MNDENKNISNTKRFVIEEITDNQYDDDVSIDVAPSPELTESSPVEDTPAFDYSALETMDFGGGFDNERGNSDTGEKVIELDMKKIGLIAGLSVLIIALIVCAVIFIPKLFTSPTSGNTHWVSGVLNAIPADYRLNEVVNDDELDSLVNGEKFFQIGRRVIEQKEELWGSNLENFRNKANVTKVDAVEIMKNLYPEAERLDINALLDFGASDYAGQGTYIGYKQKDDVNLTVAETVAFIYELVMKYGYCDEGDGPLYYQKVTLSPPASQEVTPSPTDSEQITPSPSQSPTVSDNPSVSEPTIQLSTEEVTNSDVIVTVVFPENATDMKYRLNDLPWADTSSGRQIPVSANATIAISCKVDGVEKKAEKVINNIDKNVPVITTPIYDSNPAKSCSITSVIMDNETSIKLVKFASGRRDTSHFASQGEIISSSNSQYSFTVTSNGEYTIYAEDAAGNKSVYVLNISNIDTTPPVIRVENNSENWQNRATTIYVTITDENLASAYYTSSGKREDITITNGKVDKFPITISEQGDIYITIVASDEADNMRTQTEHIRIDYTKPNIPSVQETVYVSDDEVKFKLSEATDIHSGVKEVIVKVENTGELLTPVNGYYVVANDKRISIEVVDNAGNSSFGSYMISAE